MGYLLHPPTHTSTTSVRIIRLGLYHLPSTTHTSNTTSQPAGRLANSNKFISHGLSLPRTAAEDADVAKAVARLSFLFSKSTSSRDVLFGVIFELLDDTVIHIPTYKGALA